MYLTICDYSPGKSFNMRHSIGMPAERKGADIRLKMRANKSNGDYDSCYAELSVDYDRKAIKRLIGLVVEALWETEENREDAGIFLMDIFDLVETLETRHRELLAMEECTLMRGLLQARRCK